jgi:hypothetical protein
MIRESGTKTAEPPYGDTPQVPATTHTLHCSKIDDATVVIEELAAVLGYLRGDAVGVFNALLAEFLQDAAEAVVPLLLLILRFARIGRAELHE